jgi:cytoskeletal protein CcmA (bactofilin family)
MGIFGKPEHKPFEGAPRPAAPGPAAPTPAPRAAASTPCVIGAKTQVKGEITGAETVIVEGHVEGAIRITGDLIGDCQATQRVEIEAVGRLTGNIRAPRVVIVEGATFRGNSDMAPRPDGGKA